MLLYYYIIILLSCLFSSLRLTSLGSRIAAAEAILSCIFFFSPTVRWQREVLSEIDCSFAIIILFLAILTCKYDCFSSIDVPNNAVHNKAKSEIHIFIVKNRQFQLSRHQQ